VLIFGAMGFSSCFGALLGGRNAQKFYGMIISRTLRKCANNSVKYAHQKSILKMNVKM